MTISPWGLYRLTSNIRNEPIRYKPFELYGVSDPKNDIAFPQMPQAGSNFGFNMLSMLNSLEERLVTQGDLQYGRVPQGKASALRTVRGMQSIMSQGEARPQRIIRRFFGGLCEVFAQMHELNQAFLPKGKQYRVAGMVRPGEDPYRAIDDPATFGQRYDLCGPREYTLAELVRYTARCRGLSRTILPLPDLISRIQAAILDFVPGKPFSTDNYLSAQVDSVCKCNGLLALGIRPSPVEAIVPRYLRT